MMTVVENCAPTRTGQADLSVSYSHANYKTTQRSRKSPFHFAKFLPHWRSPPIPRAEKWRGRFGVPLRALVLNLHHVGPFGNWPLSAGTPKNAFRLHW